MISFIYRIEQGDRQGKALDIGRMELYAVPQIGSTVIIEKRYTVVSVVYKSGDPEPPVIILQPELQVGYVK